MKRLIDLVVASAMLVAVTPLLLAIALAIRVVDGSPVLFSQARSGRGGRPFEFVKFRTMRPLRADESGQDHANARVTPLGRFLRRTSLDELPTLLHVVRGQMALVGPRPLPVDYLSRYDDTQARRLEVRPGLTGLAIVNGRNRPSWDERLAMDVWYADHATFSLDARILARTVRLVIRGEGVEHAPGVTMTEFVGPSGAAALPGRPLRVAHLTTIDMSLALLLQAQLDDVIGRGGEAIGISATGPFVEVIERRGVRHVPLASSTRGWSLLSDVRAAAELWRILRHERPTILHTHNPKPGLYGRVVARLAGVPIVVNTVHGLYATPDDPFVRRAAVYSLEAFAALWSDVELVQNVEDVEVMRRRHLVNPQKIRLLGNGVDLGRFRPGALDPSARASLRAGWGVDHDTVVVGTVGRLVGEKGYTELFDAVSGLAPGIRLVVAGGQDGVRRDALGPAEVRRAEAAGVVVLGHRDDVHRVLHGFDMFVLASHREGLSRAAMEAAASGLPVVATDVRGCRQVVDHGTTGLLVPVRDAGALREAMTSLAASPDRRRAMGLAARAKAEDEFDERAVVHRVMDSYSWAAARRGITLV